MLDTRYPNRAYSRLEPGIVIRLSSEYDLSYNDFGDVLRDIEAIFQAAVTQVVPRTRGSNSQRPKAVLAIREIRAGSIEILTDPYVTGLATGVAANAVFAVFLYVLRRINGRPPNGTNTALDRIPEDIISGDRLRTAAINSVERTTAQRRRLRDKRKMFGLSISIQIGASFEDVTID